MKTIYTALSARLKEKVPALRWIDLDTAQLETAAADRPAVAFPCALIGIDILRCGNITDTVQECEARVVVRLAFDQPVARTSTDAPKKVAEKSLLPYDMVAQTYAALQGYGTNRFEPLTRIRQLRENTRSGLFIYRIEFLTNFEDITADGE